MIDLCKKAKQSSNVVAGSISHRMAKRFNMENIDRVQGYAKWCMHCESKFSALMFCQQLNCLLKEKGLIDQIFCGWVFVIETLHQYSYRLREHETLKFFGVRVGTQLFPLPQRFSPLPIATQNPMDMLDRKARLQCGSPAPRRNRA